MAKYTVTIRDNETGHSEEINLDRLNYSMDSEIEYVQHPGTILSNMVVRGWNLTLRGYEANPDFIKEYEEALRDKNIT